MLRFICKHYNIGVTGSGAESTGPSIKVPGANLGGGGALPFGRDDSLNIYECVLRTACDYIKPHKTVPRLRIHVHLHGKGQS